MEVNAVIPPGGTVKRLNANIPCWVCSLKAWEALAPFVYDGLLVANFQVRPQPKMTAEQHNLHCDFLFCEGKKCKMFWTCNAAFVGSVCKGSCIEGIGDFKIKN